MESVENLDKSMLLAQNDRVYSRKNGGAFYAKKRQKRRNGKMKKRRFRLVRIRMFNTTFVGTGVLDCPQQKNFGRDIVFSADLCYNRDTP